MSGVTLPQILTHHELRLREIEEKTKTLDDVSSNINNAKSSNDAISKRVANLENIINIMKRDITTQITKLKTEFEEAKKIHVSVEENTDA